MPTKRAPAFPVNVSPAVVEERPIAIGEILKASLEAHLRAKPTRPKELRDMGKARTDWQEALRLRLEALAADPGRSDPAWKDQPDHDTLMAFYRDKGVTNG